jgi:hypothetical protein
MSDLSVKLALNDSLDREAKLFSICFTKTLDKTGTKVFTSREVQEVAQCTFDELEKIYRRTPRKR